MWFENVWNTMLVWWLLLAVLVAGAIIGGLLWRRKKANPLKKHLDHFCRCYARGEISREDFEELKKDLQGYEKKD
ncbi:MAG TPA: SHOCT domain-containing protein [Fodinibius sp.]|nr:SHOCT domain-containing protein [Fodinibius sp.]